MNYSELSLKCGLEIHQQLDTNKLFCNCPSILRSDDPNFEIRRKLHAVAGESGEVDVAAKYQSSLDKEFVYQVYDTNCLVEIDEEPPREINKEALKIVLQISLLLNCKILGITQIMRKTVVDGSNTSGFQRTVMVARDGFVETSNGKVRIESICLEEDSARIIGKKGLVDVYRLDRLGIPLIEITTSPDIKTPEQAKEVALYIGDIIRSCKVKRGIGTIRQDVNMSIKGKPRIEIKGVQDPDLIYLTIKSEIERQLNSSEKLESHVRKALADGKTEFLRPMPGAARMYPETDIPLLRISKSLIDDVKRDLPKLRKDIEGDLKKQGLTPEMVKLLFKRNKLEDYKELLNVHNDPNLVAKTLLVFPKEISKKLNIDEENVTRDSLVFLLESFSKNLINESQIKLSMERILQGVPFDEAVKFDSINNIDLDSSILKIINQNPGLSKNAYMGIIMKEFKGKVEGKILMETINKLIK